MSEIIDPNKKQEQEQPKEPKDIVLTITLQAGSGQFLINGPGDTQMYDEPLCLWLLDKAKDIIKASNSKAVQSKIIQPTFKGINRIRGAFGKR